MSYVELAVTTNYSFLRGASHPGDFVIQAASLGYAAVGIAVSRRCDLLVAVAQGKGDPAGVARVALDFLGTSDMARWMTAAMDGR